MQGDNSYSRLDLDTEDFFSNYIAGLEKEGREFDRQKEKDAYLAMKSAADIEVNGSIRGFMRDTLSYYGDGKEMLFSYIYEICWDNWVAQKRETLEMMEPFALFLELEDILSRGADSSGYTKNSNQYRWRLTMPGYYSEEWTARNFDTESLSPILFQRSFYKFGVHKFFVGLIILNILKFLENRYGLDFRSLESEYCKNLT